MQITFLESNITIYYTRIVFVEDEPVDAELLAKMKYTRTKILKNLFFFFMDWSLIDGFRSLPTLQNNCRVYFVVILEGIGSNPDLSMAQKRTTSKLHLNDATFLWKIEKSWIVWMKSQANWRQIGCNHFRPTAIGGKFRNLDYCLDLKVPKHRFIEKYQQIKVKNHSFDENCCQMPNNRQKPSKNFNFFNSLNYKLKQNHNLKIFPAK